MGRLRSSALGYPRNYLSGALTPCANEAIMTRLRRCQVEFRQLYLSRMLPTLQRKKSYDQQIETAGSAGSHGRIVQPMTALVAST